MFVGREPTTISTYFFRELRDRDRDVLFFLGPRVYSSGGAACRFPFAFHLRLGSAEYPRIARLEGIAETASRRRRVRPLPSHSGAFATSFSLALSLSRGSIAPPPTPPFALSVSVAPLVPSVESRGLRDSHFRPSLSFLCRQRDPCSIVFIRNFVAFRNFIQFVILSLMVLRHGLLNC